MVERKLLGSEFVGIALKRTVSVFLFFLFVTKLLAGTGQWNSIAIGGPIAYVVTESGQPQKDYSGNFLTVVYLENPGFKKIGKNSNSTDVAWLLAQGYRVIELDYALDKKAVSPGINSDIIAINDAIAAGSFCGLSNCSKYRSYILFEGYRLARDVPYFLDDPTVYNWPGSYLTGDSLYMDVVYPANAEEKVPVVLSFSYSNSYAGEANKHLRLKLDYTLAGFNDSFLEGAPAMGMAWAIADHPKYCNWGNGKPAGGTNDTYKSYQTNPDAGQKVKSAVRTLRVLGETCGLSGKIGIYGFSRGSDAGSMAIGDRQDSILENAGFNRGISDQVQVAALGSGVFDFTQIYNTADDGDKNLETRCPWAWGSLADHYSTWEKMGSAWLVQSAATAPVIFFYNTSDANYYQDQIAHLKARLDSLGVPTSTVIDYGTGHSVPQTAVPLTQVYTFFSNYLEPPLLTSVGHYKFQSDYSGLSLSIAPNPVSDRLNFQFNLKNTGCVRIALSNMSGSVVYFAEKQYEKTGLMSESIRLSELNLPCGIYTIRISASELSGSARFIVGKS